MAKYGYKRCSTNEDKQDVGRQLHGMTFDRLFVEYASGKNEEGRPVFQEMKNILVEGDEVFFNDLSRCGRNTKQLLITVEDLIEKGIKVTFTTENLVFVGKGGDQMQQAISKMMLTMLASVNELFLAQNSVAVKQGLKRAVAEGKKLGAASEKYNKDNHVSKSRHVKVVNHLESIRKDFTKVITLMKSGELNKNKLTVRNITDNLNLFEVPTTTGRPWSLGSAMRAKDYYGL